MNDRLSGPVGEIAEGLRRGIRPSLVENRRVLVITPDGTRTALLDRMIPALQSALTGMKAGGVDYMVALGSHRILSLEEIQRLYGADEPSFGGSRFFNHRWDRPDTLIRIGRIGSGEVGDLTEGLFHEPVDVDINRMIFEYDQVIILGPVFPHEVAGFSGGYKYLFPGVSGGEFLHFFHWVGAVATCWNTIGREDNPVRRLIDRAAGFLDLNVLTINTVVSPEGRLEGMYIGGERDAWLRAVAHSARIHIVRKKRPYSLVVGRAKRMYDELWTAGKVMYKLEPVVARGGTLIILGKHIDTVSHTWGTYLEKIGYHVRDYFLADMGRYRDIPKAVLAHSTHVKGLGRFREGVESPRIQVVLATSIPEETCERIGLGYMDPDALDPDEYRDREEEGILVVDSAGEMLYRLEREPPFEGGRLIEEE
jgi:nickel-dependent lactate racemase